MEKIPLEQDIQALSKSLKKKTKKIKRLKDERVIERYKQEIEDINKEVNEKKVLLNTEYYKKEKIYNSIYKGYLREGFEWTYGIIDTISPFKTFS